MTDTWRDRLWRGIGTTAAPGIGWWLRRRVARGKEDLVRLHERFGYASAHRPPGPLIWAHAASVGEAMAVLPLLQALLTARADLHVLLTTGTVTSAKLVAERGGPRLIHHYVPVDLPTPAQRFLKHWRPELVLWMESEFWPGLLGALKKRGVPVLLLNARISDRSFPRWRRARGTARWLLGHFAALYARSREDAERLIALGAPPAAVQEAGNLKQAAPPLPADAAELARWQTLLGDRPRWLAVSLHPGEAAAVAIAHRAAAAGIPGLLTLIVPRHPERGEAIADELRQAGLRVALRSRAEPPEGDVYIANTLGELGLWCRLSPVAFLGGSLIPHGGQNPLEPARLGCAILFGPQMFNFRDDASGLLAAQAAETVADGAALGAALTALLQDPARQDRMGAAAATFAGEQEAVLATLRAAALARLPAQQPAQAEGTDG